jgi:hypothetical protein
MAHSDRPALHRFSFESRSASAGHLMRTDRRSGFDMCSIVTHGTVLTESRIQGSLCYTGADFEAVIALMARGAYNTTGWDRPKGLSLVTMRLAGS